MPLKFTKLDGPSSQVFILPHSFADRQYQGAISIDRVRETVEAYQDNRHLVQIKQAFYQLLQSYYSSRRRILDEEEAQAQRKLYWLWLFGHTEERLGEQYDKLRNGEEIDQSFYPVAQLLGGGFSEGIELDYLIKEARSRPFDCREVIQKASHRLKQLGESQPESWLRIADHLLEQGLTKQSDLLLQEARQNFGQSLQLLDKTVKSYFSRGLFSRALQGQQRMEEYGSGANRFLLYNQANIILKSARRALSEQLLQSALQMLEQQVRQQPRHKNSVTLLSRLYLHFGKVEEATQLLTVFLSHCPFEKECWGLVSSCYGLGRDQGRYRLAKQMSSML